jgi:hypothetical protein
MFYVGQKVVCVDDHDTDLVSKGGLYVVRVVRLPYLELSGVRGLGWNDGMMASRFRPVVERKTDISIFKAMLNPSKQGADA